MENSDFKELFQEPGATLEYYKDIYESDPDFFLAEFGINSSNRIKICPECGNVFIDKSRYNRRTFCEYNLTKSYSLDGKEFVYSKQGLSPCQISNRYNSRKKDK